MDITNGPLTRIRDFDDACQRVLASCASDEERRETLSRQMDEYRRLLHDISQSGRLGRAFVVVLDSLVVLRQLREAGHRSVGDPGRFVVEAHNELSCLPGAPPEPSSADRLSLSEEIAHLDMLLHHLDAAMTECHAEAPSARLATDTNANVVIVNGTRHDVPPHWAQMIHALCEARDNGTWYVTGPEMLDLPACHGKNISREFKELTNQIPVLGEIITSDGNKGYRLSE